MTRTVLGEIIDISAPLHAHTLTYPGDPVFARTLVREIDDEGAGYNMSLLSMSAHCGTHIDAPRHFIAGGRCVHDISAARWITPALVVDTGDDPMIEPRHIEGRAVEEGMSILFRTRNCHDLARNRMIAAPVTLTLEAARLLVDLRVNLVGIDWLSIEGGDDASFPVHHLLLSHDVIILETLHLHHIEAGAYTLAVFPLHLMDSDGAPVRAALIR